MKILIVDDVPANIDSLQSILESEGFTILATPSGDRVLDVIAKSDPDLILLDAYLPDADSFHLCRNLKNNPITMGTPIMFLIGQSSASEIDRCFLSGGADYIVKPFRQEEVLARVKHQLRIKHLLREKSILLQEISQTMGGIRRPGILNKDLIWELYRWEAIRFERIKIPFTLLLARVDDFEDSEGLLSEADRAQLVAEVGGKINSNCRILDSIGEWEDNQYFVLLPGTRIEGGIVVSKKFQVILRNYSFNVNGLNLSLSMSFGLSEFPVDEDQDIEEALKSTMENAQEQLNLAIQTGPGQIGYLGT